MAAAVISSKAASLGTSAGPESATLVEATNIDVDSNIDFTVVGPCEAVELLIVSATAKTGTPSVVFTLQRIDPVTGTAFDLVASSALTDAGNTWLAISHHAAAVANHVAQRQVTEKLRLKIDYTGTPVTDVLNAVTVTAFGI
jgi:hypothetical protein